MSPPRKKVGKALQVTSAEPAEQLAAPPALPPLPPTAGQQLKVRIDGALQDGAEWDERESALLELAQRQANDIASLEDLLAMQGSTVTGSTGQSRLNPAFAELRQSRLALARILSDLKMPDEGLAGTPQIKRVKAQRAANTRWNSGAS